MSRRKLIEYTFYAVLFMLPIVLILLNNHNAVIRSERNHQTALENNSYVRVMTCIASVSPAKRTPDYVKSCYDDAEKINGITIDRFGDGK